MTLHDEIGRIVMRILLRDPYYALFLTGIDKQETTKVPTLAVGLTGVHIKLYINREFWDKLSPEHKYGVLIHEALHICYFHLLDSQHYPDRTLDNIACDLEINQYIHTDYLPETAIFLTDFQKRYPELELEPLKGRDYYYKKLKTLSAEERLQLTGEIGDNEHFWEIFESLSETEQSIIRNQIEYKMNEAAEEVRKSQGTIPGNIAELLRLREKVAPKFDWKKYIRQWVGMSKDIAVRTTRFKPNPYFSNRPSSKITYKQNILVAIDTSGSVSDSELQEFMSEIMNLHKFGHAIWIMCVDTQLYEPYKYNGSYDFQINGRGGTLFTPTLEYFNQSRDYSCMIYFTDGEAKCPPNSNKPMLWVVSSRGTTKTIKNHNGKILKIT